MYATEIGMNMDGVIFVCLASYDFQYMYIYLYTHFDNRFLSYKKQNPYKNSVALENNKKIELTLTVRI